MRDFDAGRVAASSESSPERANGCPATEEELPEILAAGDTLTTTALRLDIIDRGERGEVAFLCHSAHPE
jgi:hypothetical protein